MCGILGAVGVDIGDLQFADALKTLAHRGPDGSSVDVDRSSLPVIYSGHHRLAIIDLDSRSDQPMRSRDQRYSIIFNGEIYNFLEIKKKLEELGEVFVTTGDTEVLLYALIRWGKAALSQLDGMFALAFVDHHTREVILARDHLGVKPLYYARLGQGWVYASEIKAILACGVIPRLRHDCLGEYFANLWVMEPDTLFEGIFKLPAATTMNIALDGAHSFSVFWTLPQKINTFASESEALEALMPKLHHAVKSQLISDVPVGAYISGGVDSSIIAKLASQMTDQPLRTVGARFAKRDQGYEAIPDDGEFIDLLVAQNPDFRHTNLTLHSDLFAEYVKQIRYLDEPIADPAIVPAYLLAKTAREQGATVMLSGMGGDELFGGYGRYTALPMLEQFKRVPAMVRKSLLSLSLVAQGIPSGTFRKFSRDAERVLRASQDSWPIGYANLSGHFAAEEIDLLVGSKWRDSLLEKLRNVLKGSESDSFLRQAQLIDLKGFLSSHNLIYSDKASMAASVEVRVPLMNVDLTEFAFSLPDEFKLKSGKTKPLLKRACAEIVGSEFAYRKKAGFAMPIRSWLQGPLLKIIHGYIFSKKMTSILPQKVIQQLYDEHARGVREHTWKLWALVTLAIWLETFDVVIDAI